MAANIGTPGKIGATEEVDAIEIMLGPGWATTRCRLLKTEAKTD